MQYPGSWFGGVSPWASAGVFGSLGPQYELTMTVGGVAVKIANRRNLLIDTFADAASQDLNNITGYTEGDVVVISPANGARTVVVKDSANVNLQGVDFTMDDVYDSMLLLNVGSDKWKEISRAAN